MAKKKPIPVAEREVDLERFRRDTLSGDLRDFVLDHLRDNKNPKPWTALGEEQQEDIIDSCHRFAEMMIDRIVEIVAADGHPVIQTKLDQFAVKDGIKIVLSCPSLPDTLLALNARRGATVQIVVADSSPYTGEKAPVKVTPDQASLIDGQEPMDDPTEDDADEDLDEQEAA